MLFRYLATGLERTKLTNKQIFQKDYNYEFSIKTPKMPDPPKLEMPKVADVPSVEDEARKRQEAEDMKRRQRNRKGRRSTILTSTDYEDVDPTLNKPTLLG